MTNNNNHNNKNIPKIRFPGFNEEWKECKLGDIVKISVGNFILSNQDKTNKYPIISGGERIMGYSEKYNRNENTITISRAGTAGYISFQKDKFFLSDKCFSLEIIDKTISTYLYFELKSKQEKIYLLSQSLSVPTIKNETLKNIKIHLPSLPEQEKIATMMTLFDQKIEILNKMVECLIKMRKYLLNNMFV